MGDEGGLYLKNEEAEVRSEGSAREESSPRIKRVPPTTRAARTSSTPHAMRAEKISSPTVTSSQPTQLQRCTSPPSRPSCRRAKLPNDDLNWSQVQVSEGGLDPDDDFEDIHDALERLRKDEELDRREVGEEGTVEEGSVGRRGEGDVHGGSDDRVEEVEVQEGLEKCGTCVCELGGDLGDGQDRWAGRKADLRVEVQMLHGELVSSSLPDDFKGGDEWVIVDGLEEGVGEEREMIVRLERKASDVWTTEL